MEKINTIARTISVPNAKECGMIISALRAKAEQYKEMSLKTNYEKDFTRLFDMSKEYNELANFIENQLIK